jgi:hypothetical protein
MSQQIYPQNALTQNSIPIINPVQLHNVEQKVCRKRYRNMDDHEKENAKKQDY